MRVNLSWCYSSQLLKLLAVTLSITWSVSPLTSPLAGHFLQIGCIHMMSLTVHFFFFSPLHISTDSASATSLITSFHFSLVSLTLQAFSSCIWSSLLLQAPCVTFPSFSCPFLVVCSHERCLLLSLDMNICTVFVLLDVWLTSSSPPQSNPKSSVFVLFNS